DPDRASTFALRDEWMGHGLRRQGRIAGGYGALIKFLVSECRGQGATIHLFSVVTAIEESRGRIAAYCDDGTIYEADAAILTVPLPILRDISLPRGVREKVTGSVLIIGAAISSQAAQQRRGAADRGEHRQAAGASALNVGGP